MQRLFLLEPQYRERVWGGQRLKASDPPIGEAWIAFEESRVKEGEHEGLSLAGLTALYGERLLGAEVAARFGSRFPILVKLLDCADWLSVQVHPDDEQARRLVGPGHYGKTEAWHFLDTDPGAVIYAGVKAGTSKADLEAAIRSGRILDVAQKIAVSAGETYLLPAGTLHALGPGLLLYELQQASDTTYRVYDWDRPAKAGRQLHIEESVAVTDPRQRAEPAPAPELEGTAAATLLSCPHFELQLLQIASKPFEGDTGGRAFRVVTSIRGDIDVSCAGETVKLGLYESLLISGAAGAYRLSRADATALALVATLPPVEERAASERL